MKSCTTEGCDRPVQARGLCGPCYSYWHRAQKKYTITCGHCGQDAQVPRRGKDRGKYCSRRCSSQAALNAALPVRIEKMKRDAARPTARQCQWCNALHFESAKYCSDACREASRVVTAKTMFGPMRAAIECGSPELIIEAIRAKSLLDDVTGCWTWTGPSTKSRKGGAYPVYKSGKTQWQVHRLSLEQKLGAPLGSQTAHHVCANSLCVNPDHLQQARNDYVRRIVALEKALAAERPGHPLLAEAPLAGILRSA